MQQLKDLFSASLLPPIPLSDPSTWKEFRYADIFEIRNGYYNKKPPESTNPSDIPFIGATEYNNGVTSYVTKDNLLEYSRDGSTKDEPLAVKLFPAKCITVSNNGSVGEAFYQARPFTCTHDVNPLYLKDKSVELTPALGMFIASVIRADKYRWGYGRKWRPSRMPSSRLKLPVTAKGTPDWALMERFIKGCRFSATLGE